MHLRIATHMFRMYQLLKQIKKRRLELDLKQHDLLPLIGMSRQQYQRLEAKGNPRLNTLEQIAKAMKSEVLLIPEEKMHAVMEVIRNENPDPQQVKEILKKEKKPEEADHGQRDLWD